MRKPKYICECCGYIKKSERLVFYNTILVLLFFLILIGAYMNIVVISSNDNKMPVYTSIGSINTTEHFSFQNKEDIKYFKYSDRFHLKIGEYRYLYYSLGDIIMTFTLIPMIVILRFSLQKSYHLHKLKKEIESIKWLKK